MLKLVVVWCLAGDDVEMSSEGHEIERVSSVLGLVVMYCQKI